MSPEIREVLGKEYRKGCGFLVLCIGAVFVAIMALPGWFLKGNVLPEFIGAVLVLVAVHAYSKRIAFARLECARRAKKAKDWESVVELTEPFAQSGVLLNKSRFDKSGEAHYLLMEAYARLGRADAAMAVKQFLVRTRRSEWSEKAKGFRVS